MITQKDIQRIECGANNSGIVRGISLELVERLREKLCEWCDHYRKSNELWYKSQDENLDDFEDAIIEIFGVEGEK